MWLTVSNWGWRDSGGWVGRSWERFMICHRFSIASDCSGYKNITFSFFSFSECWGLSESCNGMSGVQTACAGSSRSCRGGGGGQAGCGFSPWKHDTMMKSCKKWSCRLCFLEPQCFRRSVGSKWDPARPPLPGCAWQRGVVPGLVLVSLACPLMWSRWTLRSSWRHDFGPPTCAWFLLLCLHPPVPFDFAAGSSPELEWSWHGILLRLPLIPWSQSLLLCAERDSNRTWSFLQVKYSCRIYHVLQSPHSACNISYDSLGLVLQDRAITSLELQGCFFMPSLHFGCCLTSEKTQSSPQVSVLLREALVACSFLLSRCVDHQTSNTAALGTARMLGTRWAFRYCNMENVLKYIKI